MKETVIVDRLYPLRAIATVAFVVATSVVMGMIAAMTR